MISILEKLNRFFCNMWCFAVLDLSSGLWKVRPKVSILSYLKAQNAKGNHILIKPETDIAPFYLLVDDLTWSLVCQHHQYKNGLWKPGRMVVETSPHNYQIWLRSDRSLNLEEKRYWLKKLCNDPAADPHNRWGRSPGFRNRKDKYRDSEGRYPLSRLIWIDWNRKANIPFVKLPQKISQPHTQVRSEDYYRSIQISRSNYEKDDESATDFSYALALIRRGFSNTAIEKRILAERTNWKNHKGSRRMQRYLERTIRRARFLING